MNLRKETYNALSEYYKGVADEFNEKDKVYDEILFPGIEGSISKMHCYNNEIVIRVSGFSKDRLIDYHFGRKILSESRDTLSKYPYEVSIKVAKPQSLFPIKKL